MISPLLLSSVVSVSSNQCTTPIAAGTGAVATSCYVFDGVASLPSSKVWLVHDAYPMNYFVTNPCQNVTQADTNCTSYSGGDSAGSPAYAEAGASDGECYALGHLGDAMPPTLIDETDPGKGVVLEYSGGVGGRRVQFILTCDPTVDPLAGPEAAVGKSMVLPAAQCPAAATLPVPTKDQLAFQELELGALICYNMATTMGSQGCSAHNVPAASVFNDAAPEKVDTDQWCGAIASFGGTYATIVAKHVEKGRDVVRQFVDSCNAVGVRLGIYYSVVSNEYLNVGGGIVRPASTATKSQTIVTQDQYADIVVQQLTELWTNYGTLTEIWFDGGFAVPGLEQKLLTLLNKTQPHAVIFNGCGLSPNAIAWIGTESGHAPEPERRLESDLTLQNSDTWFYQGRVGYRSLAEMVGIYHTTVGHGTTMLLNVAPPPNSTLPSTAIQEYAKLGKFIAECYGVGATPSPTALASTAGYCANCTTIKLTLPETSASATTAAGVGVGVGVGVGADGVASTSSASASTGRSFDRFLIKEDMAGGQRVRAFTIDVDGVSVFNGSAIGRSLIALLPANVTGKEVTLTVTAAVAMPSFRLFAVPNPASCIVGGGGGGGQCALQENTFTLGPASQKLPVKSVAECCTACGQEASCAIFMAVPTSTNTSGSVVGDQGFECSLIIAEQGSRVQAGVVSGSPNTALF
eukprot:gene10054-18971_t